MDRSVPGRVIASCFALCGFAVAMLSGLDASVTPATALARGLVSMVACFVVGAVIGAAAERCIREHFESFVQSNPLPPEPMLGEPAARPGQPGSAPGV